MKKIIIKSKLSEDEALSKLREISDRLLKDNVLSKGDELVADIDTEDNGDVMITINGSVMNKENYSKIKKDLLSIGDIKSNDLKNFDDEDKTPAQGSDATEATGEEKADKEAAVISNKIVPALATEKFHDTSELLFDLGNQNKENLNNKSMDNVQSLLFSAEELGNKTIESLFFSDEELGINSFTTLYFSDEELKEEKVETPEDKKPEEKNFDTLYFSSEELGETVNFDTLYFSNEELGLNDLNTLYFSAEELHDQAAPANKTEKEDMNKECPIAKEDAKKALMELRRKQAEGKELTVAEKYFCDSASKMFTDEELKEELHDDKIKAEDFYKKLLDEAKEKKFTTIGELTKFIESKSDEIAKVDGWNEDQVKKLASELKLHDEKKDQKPEDAEIPKTKEELIKELNKENEFNTLHGVAKSEKNKIK